jgi:AbrB family looped-hinge helix DNA binding protein
MEFAKITSKGQITIPVRIRKALKLKEGDRVVFMCDGDRAFLENAARRAIHEAQEAFAAMAEELKLEKEEDIAALAGEICRVVRESGRVARLARDAQTQSDDSEFQTHDRACLASE